MDVREGGSGVPGPMIWTQSSVRRARMLSIFHVSYALIIAIAVVLLIEIVESAMTARGNGYRGTSFFEVARTWGEVNDLETCQQNRLRAHKMPTRRLKTKHCDDLDKKVAAKKIRKLRNGARGGSD